MAVLTYNEKGGDFAVIEAGVYPAKITEVELTESTMYTTKDGEPKQQVQIDFTVSADDCNEQEDVRVRTWAGFSFGPKSKLTPWVQAILGITPGPGVEFDTDDLLNKRCRIMVGTKFSTDGVERNTIKEVLPVRSKGEKVAEKPVKKVAATKANDDDDVPF